MGMVRASRGGRCVASPGNVWGSSAGKIYYITVICIVKAASICWRTMHPPPLQETQTPSVLRRDCCGTGTSQSSASCWPAAASCCAIAVGWKETDPGWMT
jgi:hypothetical protein